MEGTKRKRKSSVERNVIYHVGIPCTLPCIFNLQLPKSLHVSSENRMGVGYLRLNGVYDTISYFIPTAHTQDTHTLSYSHAHVLHIHCINGKFVLTMYTYESSGYGTSPTPLPLCGPSLPLKQNRNLFLWRIDIFAQCFCRREFDSGVNYDGSFLHMLQNVESSRREKRWEKKER